MQNVKSTHDLRNSLNTLTMHAELGKMLTNGLGADKSTKEIVESFDTILAMAQQAAKQLDGYDLIKKQEE